MLGSSYHEAAECESVRVIAAGANSGACMADRLFAILRAQSATMISAVIAPAEHRFRKAVAGRASAPAR